MLNSGFVVERAFALSVCFWDYWCLVALTSSCLPPPSCSVSLAFSLLPGTSARHRTCCVRITIPFSLHALCYCPVLPCCFTARISFCALTAAAACLLFSSRCAPAFPSRLLLKLPSAHMYVSATKPFTTRLGTWSIILLCSGACPFAHYLPTRYHPRLPFTCPTRYPPHTLLPRYVTVTHTFVGYTFYPLHTHLRPLPFIDIPLHTDIYLPFSLCYRYPSAPPTPASLPPHCRLHTYTYLPLPTALQHLHCLPHIPSLYHLPLPCTILDALQKIISYPTVSTNWTGHPFFYGSGHASLYWTDSHLAHVTTSL